PAPSLSYDDRPLDDGPVRAIASRAVTWPQCLLVGGLCLVSCAAPPPRVEEPLAAPLTGPVGVATPTLEDAGLPAQPASLVVEAPADPPEEPALRHPFHEALPSPAELAQGPAHRLANLSPADCRRRLSEAELPLERWRGPAP